MTLRRRLDIDQKQMGDLLGVSREWVSRLERDRGEFSEIIRLKIEELEKGKSSHKRDGDSHAGTASEDHARHGTSETITREIKRHIDLLIEASKNDVKRLGWIHEQLREHVAIPKNWVTNEEINRSVREERRREREIEEREGRLPHQPASHTAKSA